MNMLSPVARSFQLLKGSCESALAENLSSEVKFVHYFLLIEKTEELEDLIRELVVLCAHPI